MSAATLCIISNNFTLRRHFKGSCRAVFLFFPDGAQFLCHLRVFSALEYATWACFTAYFVPFKLAFYLQGFFLSLERVPNGCTNLASRHRVALSTLCFMTLFFCGPRCQRGGWTAGCGLWIGKRRGKEEIGIFEQVTLLACTERSLGAASNGCTDTLAASKNLNGGRGGGITRKTDTWTAGNEAGGRY